MPTLNNKLLESYKAWNNLPLPPSFTIAKELGIDRPVFWGIEEDKDKNLLTNEEEDTAVMMDLGAQATAQINYRLSLQFIFTTWLYVSTTDILKYYVLLKA